MPTNIIHMLATRQSHVMRRPGIFFFAKNRNLQAVFTLTYT